MAFAGIPPVGEMHKAEVNRQRRILEQTTVDPVLRYQLREQRLSDSFTELGNTLVAQARANAKKMEAQEREAQRAEMEFYSKRYRIKK